MSHDGDVFLFPPADIHATCIIEVLYFPYDDQICYTKIGGTYKLGKSELQFIKYSQQLLPQTIIQNGEWDLKNVTSKIYHDKTHLYYFFQFKRKSTYYNTNILAFMVLLCFILGLVMMVPIESNNRIQMSMQILVSFSVLYLAIKDQIPETSTGIPIITKMLITFMVINTLVIAESVLVECIYYDMWGKLKAIYDDVKEMSQVRQGDNESANLVNTRGEESANVVNTRGEESANVVNTIGEESANVVNTRGEESANFVNMRGEESDNVVNTRGEESTNVVNTRGDGSTNVVNTLDAQRKKALIIESLDARRKKVLIIESLDARRKKVLIIDCISFVIFCLIFFIATISFYCHINDHDPRNLEQVAAKCPDSIPGIDGGRKHA